MDHGAAPCPATRDARAMIGRGQVRHQRMRPAANAFAYPVFFLMLPMRALRRDPSLLAVPRRRRALLSFDDRDHGDGGPDALAWAEALLLRHGIDDVDGEIWLQTFPRVLGYVFKPVSFWYCHRVDGSLAAVVAEVNNTFGDRHCYVLRPGAGRGVAWGEELRADKALHVSPFCRVEGGYRFRFLRCTRDGAERVVARVDHDDALGPLLRTSVAGALQPLTRRSARRALLAHPLHSFGVIARIHWQALGLWLKRVPFFSRPEASREPLTR